MYTILLNANKQLISTHREVIIQKSNLVDKIRFLVPTVIGDNDISDFSAVYVEYRTPVTKSYYIEKLTKSDEMYNETHYQYIVPVDTHLTDEAGEVEIQLSFYALTTDNETIYDDEGNVVPQNPIQAVVFKTTACNVTIAKVEDWQQYVPNESLLSIDQRISRQLAIEKGISARQEEIVAVMQKGLIDDQNISDLTTYSSKKIEEKFIDKQEVDNELTEREITAEYIDEMFDEDAVDGELSHAEPINTGDIDDMFGNDDDSSNNSNTGENIDVNDDNGDTEPITDISDNEIDKMFGNDD